jgi:hypothetical protein
MGVLVATRSEFPPVENVRPLGPDADALAAGFRRRVFAGPVAATSGEAR